MDSTDLFLIDRNRLFRHGLKRLLDETPFSVRGEAEDLKEAQQHLTDGPPPAVIVVDLADSNDDDLARLKSLRETLPSRIVVLTADVNLQRFVKVIRIGVQGYITKDISLDALVQVLRLAMLGEEIFSSRLLAVASERLSSIGETTQTDIAAAELSLRERRVLSFVSNGCSNKAIARTMAISEATVKIHVRDLLRKLNVRNRTQIATWALANGYSKAEAREDEVATWPHGATLYQDGRTERAFRTERTERALPTGAADRRADGGTDRRLPHHDTHAGARPVKLRTTPPAS
jgi:two-component system, NarL family, nitrate/nitrite response regulator NarL